MAKYLGLRGPERWCFMNEQEVQQFFAANGYYPVKVAPPRKPDPKKSLYRSTTTPQGAFKQRPGGLALKGWRAPLHWAVPPAFERPGMVYETIGHEAFQEAVR